MARKDLHSDLRVLWSTFQAGVDQLTMENPLSERRMRDVLDYITDVVGPESDFLDTYVGHVLTEDKTVRAHKQTVAKLGVALRMQDARNIELFAEALLSPFRSYLQKASDVAFDRVNNLLRAQGESAPDLSQARLQRQAINLLISRIEQGDLSQRLREANRLADESVEKAQKAAVEAQNAAGVASGATLTKRFRVLSRKHFWAASIFRFFTAAGVAIGLWIALRVDFEQLTPGAEDATAQAILRVSVLAGVLGLATYFGRQAAYHRDVSTWASTIKEQLLTFEGYINLVDDDDLKNQIRATFAARVFGTSPEAKDEPGVTLSATALSDIAGAVAKSIPQRP